MDGVVVQEKLMVDVETKGLPTKAFMRRLAFRFAGLLIIFSIQVLLARLMGPKQFGHYAVITTILLLLSTFSTFGFDSTAVFFLRHYINEKNYGMAKGFIRYSNRFIFLSSVACGVGVFFFLLAFAKRFNISFSESLLWTMLMLPCLSLLRQTHVLIQFFGGKKAILPITVTLPFLTFLGSLYYYHANNKLTVDAVMMVAFLATLLLYFIYRSRLSRRLPEEFAEATVEYSGIKWTHISVSHLIYDLAALLIRHLPVLLISYYMFNPDAGYFYAALKLSALVGVSGSILEILSKEEVMEFHRRKQWKKLNEFVRASVFKLLSIAIPVSLVLVIFGKNLLGLFGDSFVTMYPVLLLLVASQVLIAIASFTAKTYFNFSTNYRHLLFLVGTLLVLLVSSILLIPHFKTTGAAIALLIAAAFFNVTTSVRHGKKVK